MPLTHYEILGLAPTASTEEIKRAYRRQALHWHPDRNPANPKAHRRFIAIKDAYSVLSNADRRAHYDTVLRGRAAHQAPQAEGQRPTPRAAPRAAAAPSSRGTPTPRQQRWGLRFAGGFLGIVAFIATLKGCGFRLAPIPVAEEAHWAPDSSRLRLDSSTEEFFKRATFPSVGLHNPTSNSGR